MAAITGFTYTNLKQRKLEGSPSVKESTMKLAAGNGALTYPTGGIPLDKNSLGLPNNLESLTFVDSDLPDGYIYKYDNVNKKIMMFEGDNNNAADGPLIEVVNTATPTISINVISKGY